MAWAVHRSGQAIDFKLFGQFGPGSRTGPLRDSEGLRPKPHLAGTNTRGLKRERSPEVSHSVVQNNPGNFPLSLGFSKRVRVLCFSTRKPDRNEKDDQVIERWKTSLSLQPSTQLPASERLAALRDRCARRWESGRS